MTLHASFQVADDITPGQPSSSSSGMGDEAYEKLNKTVIELEKAVKRVEKVYSAAREKAETDLKDTRMQQAVEHLGDLLIQADGAINVMCYLS